MGPLVDVVVPTDKVNGRPSGFAFVEFRSELDAEYALKVLNMVSLYGRSMRVRKSGEGGPIGGTTRLDTGANLFVGNLPQDASEKSLYDTFSAFGAVQETRIQRDLETGVGKGFAFVVYEDFEASDAAIEALNGQFMMGRPIVVQYALRKDSRSERHGSIEERSLAARAKAAKQAAASVGKAVLPPPAVHFASALGGLTQSVALGVERNTASSMLGIGGAPMLGLPPALAPLQMLPPAAILQATGGLIPPLPPPPPMGGLVMTGAGGFTLPALVPPPLPAHFRLPNGAVDNRPAWMKTAQ